MVNEKPRDLVYCAGLVALQSRVNGKVSRLCIKC